MVRYAILGVIAFAVFMIIYYYNRLIAMKNLADEAWSSVEVQLKRRYNLIPNLVETVKGYATHEKETLERVVKARTAVVGASSFDERLQAEGEISGLLRSLFALSERYPELKASTNFLELQKELSEIVEQIQLARRYYNAVVRDYNTLVESFPSNLVARLFNFNKRSFFEIPGNERDNVRVSF